MHIRVALVALLAAFLRAQSGVPVFRADRVLPSGGDRPAQLIPGMLVSIYGTDLGPQQGCIGQADTHATETPSPLLPDQSFVNTLIYPKELCGVRVMFGDTPAGLLYVQQSQINFKVPQDAPMEGTRPLRVVNNGRTSAAAEMRLGLETATLSLGQPARVNGPVWIQIKAPLFPPSGDLQYPVGVQPNDFGCHEVEVRRDGVLLPRIPVRTTGGMVLSGPPCGHISLPGPEARYKNRLPIHLQYRFDQPGRYEVRYTRRRRRLGMSGSQPIFQTAWTPIEILPAQTEIAHAPPENPAEALSDYLPGILGFPDDAHLHLLTDYLYSSTDVVRRYASLALGYWPEDTANRYLTDLLRRRGPSDVIVEPTLRTPGALDLVLPYLQSQNPVLLRGAIIGVTRSLSADPPLLTGQARSRAEAALIAASKNALRIGDAQTASDYAAALGGVHDPRARDLLWNFVERDVQTEQSLIAITWLKDRRDLPRLAALLEAPAKGDTMKRTYASLPYAIRSAYGDAALPVLESAIQKSDYVWVQTNCARELVLAGRKSGFAFIAHAIEQNKLYRRELAQFVQERFPELRGADDSRILTFLKSRL